MNASLRCRANVKGRPGAGFDSPPDVFNVEKSMDIEKFVAVIGAAVNRKRGELQSWADRGWLDYAVQLSLFSENVNGWEVAVRKLHDKGALRDSLNGGAPTVGENARDRVARLYGDVSEYVWTARAAWFCTTLEERHALGYGSW